MVCLLQSTSFGLLCRNTCAQFLSNAFSSNPIRLDYIRLGLDEKYRRTPYKKSLTRLPTLPGHGVPSSLVFLIALGIHSLFEGAAIGLQTEKEKLLEFGVAVMIHEALMALSFGMEVGCLFMYKAFRHVETLFVQGRNLYLAGLLLVGEK